MGISYFNNKSWVDISREERLFCCHLYFLLKKKENMEIFIDYINNNGDLLIAKENWKPLNKNNEWEVGYEVCFYRDYLKNILGRGINETDFPQKRTFDLCLFSENKIVIIEAKAQQGFNTEQLNTFLDDRIIIPELIREKDAEANIGINVIGLVSSRYKYLNSPITFKDYFEKMLTWAGIYDLFKEKIFEKADMTYGN